MESQKTEASLICSVFDLRTKLTPFPISMSAEPQAVRDSPHLVNEPSIDPDYKNA